MLRSCKANRGRNGIRFSGLGRFPSRGCALKGVTLHGLRIPELHFTKSLKVPTITEDLMATTMRLASEGMRPEFCYVRIQPGHPFHGRQFKQYSPQWLRGTELGEILAELDWIMKTLNIGIRSNESKSNFFLWKNSSNLIGLADRTDFPLDQLGGSIIMSCGSVKAVQNENQLWFTEEPQISITDETSSKYSEYITKHYDSVAYHDEPRLFHMKEIVKMIMLAEWLKLKGITADDKWIRKHTKPKYESSEITVATDDAASFEEFMEVLGSLDCLKDIDAKSISLKQLLNIIINEMASKNLYPSITFSEKQKFETELLDFISSIISTVTDKNLTTGAEPQSPDTHMVDSIPNPGKESVATPYEKQSVLDLPLADLWGKCTAAVLPGVCVKFDKLSFNVQSTVVHLNGIVKHVNEAQNEIITEEIKTTYRIGVDDFDSLYADMNPNQFIAPCVHVATKNSPGFIHGRVPNVCSWNELYSETVPWPQRWMSESSSIHTTTGGISTASIPAAVCVPAATAVGAALSHTIPTAVGTALRSIPAAVSTALHSIPAVVGTALNSIPVIGAALHVNKTSHSHPRPKRLRHSVHHTNKKKVPLHGCLSSPLLTATVQTNTAMLGNEYHQNTAEETVQTNTAMLGNEYHQNTAEETDQTNTAMLGNDDHQNTAEETDQTNTAMLGNDDHQNTAEETDQTNTAMLGNDDHQNTAEETVQTNTAILGNEDQDKDVGIVLHFKTSCSHRRHKRKHKAHLAKKLHVRVLHGYKSSPLSTATVEEKISQNWVASAQARTDNKMPSKDVSLPQSHVHDTKTTFGVGYNDSNALNVCDGHGKPIKKQKSCKLVCHSTTKVSSQNGVPKHADVRTSGQFNFPIDDEDSNPCNIHLPMKMELAISSNMSQH